jgi:hypothetical protein
VPAFIATERAFLPPWPPLLMVGLITLGRRWALRLPNLDVAFLGHG